MSLIPVTPAFLRTLAACSSDGAGSLIVNGTDPPVVLHPRIGESGAWALGTSTTGAYTMSAATLRELQDATGALSDGTYMAATGALKQLAVVNGEALPDTPPPPPPPR